MAFSLKNVTMFGAPIAAGVALLAVVINARSPPAQQPVLERATVVRVITLEETGFTPQVVGYGTVKPARTWNAVSQVSGRLDYVHPKFKSGNLLKAGTLILKINPRDYELAEREAEANIRSGKAKLTELRQQQGNIKKSLEIERSSIAIKQKELNRKQGLVKRGTISRTSVEVVQRDLLGQRGRIQDLENSLLLFPTQISVQEEQIAVYEAKLETAKLNLQRTRISLPFDARIAEAKAEVTQYVGVGTSLGSVDGIGAAEVAAQVPQSQFRKFVGLALPADYQLPELNERVFEELVKKLGWSAVVRIGTGKDVLEWPARFVRTSDTIDPVTRTVGAIVSVDAPYANVRPGIKPPLIKGMFVEVVIKSTLVPGQIVVPRSALRDGQARVVNKKNRLELRPVKIKLTQDDRAVVASGLRTGDRLIVSDFSPAISGMLLSPLEHRQRSQSARQDNTHLGAAK